MMGTTAHSFKLTNMSNLLIMSTTAEKRRTVQKGEPALELFFIAASMTATSEY